MRQSIVMELVRVNQYLNQGIDSKDLKRPRNETF